MIKIALKYGIICSIIILLQILIFYIIGPANLNVFLAGFISLVVNVLFIYFAIVAVRKHRTDQNGIINFSESFSIAVLVFILYLLTSTIFSFILYNYIDPGYAEKIKVSSIQKIEALNIPDLQKEKYIQKLEETNADFNLPRAVQTLGKYTALYVVISIIIAASIKKNVNETNLT